MLRTLLLIVASTTVTSAVFVACGGTSVGPDASTGDSGNDVSTQDSPGVDAADASDASDAGDAALSCVDLAILDAGAATLCSQSSTVDAALAVHNNCTVPVDLWWVDYQCGEVLYGTINAGTQATQPSFGTHPWRLRLADAGGLVKDIPPLKPGLTTVSVP